MYLSCFLIILVCILTVVFKGRILYVETSCIFFVCLCRYKFLQITKQNRIKFNFCSAYK